MVHLIHTTKHTFRPGTFNTKLLKLQEQGYLKGVKVYALPDGDSDDEKAK
jgi:hypothetical protein